MRLGGFEVDHFADKLGRFDRVYVGATQIYPKPAPTVTGVDPASGGESGGQLVTITGTTFYGTPVVTVGGVLATSVTLVSGTVLTAVVPAQSAGSVSLTVTTASGTSNAVQFEYLAITPMGMNKVGQFGHGSATFAKVTGWAADVAGFPNTAMPTDGELEVKTSGRHTVTTRCVARRSGQVYFQVHVNDLPVGEQFGDPVTSGSGVEFTVDDTQAFDLSAGDRVSLRMSRTSGTAAFNWVSTGSYLRIG